MKDMSKFTIHKHLWVLLKASRVFENRRRQDILFACLFSYIYGKKSRTLDMLNKHVALQLQPKRDFARMSVCASRAWSSHNGPKRASELLGLELGMLVNSHVGAGDWNLVLCESSHCSHLLNQLICPPPLRKILRLLGTAGAGAWLEHSDRALACQV